MSANRQSRRELLRAGGGVLSLALLGGCLDNSSDDGDENELTLSAIPADATFAGVVDMESIFEDQQLRKRIDVLTENTVGMLFGGPNQILGRLQTFEEAAGLNHEAITEVRPFVQLEQQAAGLILDADWSPAEIQNGLRKLQPGVESTTHNGQSVHETDGTGVGILPDGRYVVGTPKAVRNSIDAAKDSDDQSSELSTGFEDVRDGYVQFAFTLQPAVIPEELFGVLQPETVEDMKYGHGAMFRGSERGGQITFEFSATQSAKTMVQFLEAGRKRAAEEFTDLNKSMGADVSGTIRNSTIERTDSTVILKNEAAKGIISTIVAIPALGFVIGTDYTSDAPQFAEFEGKYSDGTVTVTCTAAGNSIAASQLYVIGTGLDQTGTWGTLSDSTSPDGSVGPGDSVTISADSDFAARVVWEPTGVGRRRYLGMFEGPDA